MRKTILLAKENMDLHYKPYIYWDFVVNVSYCNKIIIKLIYVVPVKSALFPWSSSVRFPSAPRAHSWCNLGCWPCTLFWNKNKESLPALEVFNYLCNLSWLDLTPRGGVYALHLPAIRVIVTLLRCYRYCYNLLNMMLTLHNVYLCKLWCKYVSMYFINACFTFS